jgi:hypothetical protein
MIRSRKDLRGYKASEVWFLQGLTVMFNRARGGARWLQLGVGLPYDLERLAYKLHAHERMEQTACLSSEAVNFILITHVIRFLAINLAKKEDGPIAARFTLY